MRRAGLLLVALLASLTMLSGSAMGASYDVYICGSWSNNQGPFVPAAGFGMAAGLS